MNDLNWAIECQLHASFFAFKARELLLHTNDTGTGIYDLPQLLEDAKISQKYSALWAAKSFNVRGLFD